MYITKYIWILVLLWYTKAGYGKPTGPTWQNSKNHHWYWMTEYCRIRRGVSWIPPPWWFCLVLFSCFPQKQWSVHIFGGSTGRKWNFRLLIGLGENNVALVLRLQLQGNREEVTHGQAQQSCVRDNENQVGDKQSSKYWNKGTQYSQYHLNKTAISPSAGLRGVLTHNHNIKVGNADETSSEGNNMM